MKYTKFEILNFKGIEELIIDLDKQPSSKVITLVGLNESGKTSILQAINLLHNDMPESERHRLIPKRHKLNFTGTVSIIGTLSVSREDNLIISQRSKELGIANIKPLSQIIIERSYKYKDSAYTETLNYWTLRLEVQRTLQDKFTILDAKDKEWQLIVNYISENLLPKILYYSDFLFDFPAKVYIDEETSVLKKQTQFRDVIQDILTSIDKELTIEDHIIKRLKNKSEGSQEALDHTLSRMSTQITKVVLGAWKNIMNLHGKELFVEAKSEIITTTVNKSIHAQQPQKKEVYYLEFRLKEGAEKYYISERSLGFKWFFTFLLFTEFRKNRKTDIGETLFLLDEPASNLHSTAQKKLLAKFSELVQNSRLIYTTHSHHLINPIWLSGTYVVINDATNYKKSFDFDTNATNIKAVIYKQFVAKYPKRQDYFQPILDALDHQPGLLEKIPNIIITEGKFDYYIFKYVNEVIMQGSHKGLFFYPGSGADGNDQVIRLYMAWRRNFKIILDGDKAGAKAKPRYVKNIGEEIKSSIISFLDIDESWNCAIEELFSEDEKISITKTFDSSSRSYEKSKFNSAIHNLYTTRTRIELSDITLARFTKVFMALK